MKRSGSSAGEKEKVFQAELAEWNEKVQEKYMRKVHKET